MTASAERAAIPALDSPEAIADTVRRLGFLPFFKNPVPGFSIAEHTPPALWFSDTQEGPWEWKGPVARSGCVYGKFFSGRAGFISRDWFPVFANYRRRGYDFDALFDDGLASHGDRQLYELLAQRGSMLSKELKGLAGAKGFDGRITRLQMECYVVIADFEYQRDRQGRPYGWGVARYAAPEALFGAEFMAEAYREEPEASRARVYAHLRALWPEAEERQIKKLLGDP